MNMKKFAALVVALVMALTMVNLTVSAAGETSVEIKTSVPVFEGTEFTLDVYLTPGNAEQTLKGFQFDFTYDPAKVTVAKDQYGLLAYTIHPYNVMAQLVMGSVTLDETTGKIGFSFAANNNFAAAGLAIPADNKIVSFTFTAKEGTAAVGQFITAIDEAIFVDKTGAEEKYTGSTLVSATTLTDMAVNEMPDAPSVSALGYSTDELRHEGTVSASYTFNDGSDSTSDDAEYDGSEVKWYVEGSTTSIGTGNELTISDATWVGKKLTYTVAAKVKDTTRPNYAATGDPVATETASAVVKAAADYLADFKAGTTVETTGITDAKITLTKEATASIVFDDTYPAAAYADNGSTYAWYLLDASVEDATAAAAATVSGDPVSSTNSVTFEDTTLLDRWVKLVVTPKALVAGEAFEADAVEIVAQIFGQPPTLADDAAAEIAKLEAKKYSTSSTPNVTAVEFDSNVAEGAGDQTVVNYSYKWYLTSTLTNAETFAAAEKTEITAEAALGTPGKVKLSKVDGAAGKYLVAVITAADDLGISSDVTLFFQNAIKEGSSGGSATQGGASLVTGTSGPTGGEDTTPGTTTEDDDIISDTNPKGNPTDGEERGAAQFTDLDKEVYAWAYDYIDALTKAGVIKGMTETTFVPEGTTTVAQAVALAVRVTGLTAEDAKTDKVDEAHWSYAEMAIADANGVLAIFGDAVDADAAITREQIAAVVYAAAVAAEVELPADAEAIEFSDASAIAEGAAEAVDALVKAGVINGMGDGTFAPKANTTRAQMAKIIGIVAEIIG